jgi:hypothetical protein
MLQMIKRSMEDNQMDYKASVLERIERFRASMALPDLPPDLKLAEQNYSALKSQLAASKEELRKAIQKFHAGDRSITQATITDLQKEAEKLQEKRTEAKVKLEAERAKHQPDFFTKLEPAIAEGAVLLAELYELVEKVGDVYVEANWKCIQRGVEPTTPLRAGATAREQAREMRRFFVPQK